MPIPGPRPRTPADVAAALERGVPLPPGPGHRYAGYAVLDVRFASGDILALRRFPVASIGMGYTSVWHRAPNGEWTLYSDVPRSQGCDRYFADLFTHAIVAPIRIDWTGPRALVVDVDGGRALQWHLDLAGGAATAAFNAAAAWLRPAWWAKPNRWSITQRAVDVALRVGGLQLVKHLPEGMRVETLPEAVWAVDASRAILAGRDLGRLRADAAAGARVELYRPPRSLFAAGAMVIHPRNAAEPAGAR